MPLAFYSLAAAALHHLLHAVLELFELAPVFTWGGDTHTHTHTHTYTHMHTHTQGHGHGHGRTHTHKRFGVRRNMPRHQPRPPHLTSDPLFIGVALMFAKPYTLQPTRYTLHPIPYILHPTPYALHLTFYTLYPIPYILYCTPHPKLTFHSRGAHVRTSTAGKSSCTCPHP